MTGLKNQTRQLCDDSKASKLRNNASRRREHCPPFFSVEPFAGIFERSISSDGRPRFGWCRTEVRPSCLLQAPNARLLTWKSPGFAADKTIRELAQGLPLKARRICDHQLGTQTEQLHPRLTRSCRPAPTCRTCRPRPRGHSLPPGRARLASIAWPPCFHRVAALPSRTHGTTRPRRCPLRRSRHPTRPPSPPARPAPARLPLCLAAGWPCCRPAPPHPGRARPAQAPGGSALFAALLARSGPPAAVLAVAGSPSRPRLRRRPQAPAPVSPLPFLAARPAIFGSPSRWPD